jgi:hypothetical protein
MFLICVDQNFILQTAWQSFNGTKFHLQFTTGSYDLLYAVVGQILISHNIKEKRKLWVLGVSMGNEGRGTMFKIKDSKYMLYLPVRLVDDSMFPFKCDKSMYVLMSFKPGSDKLVIEKWEKSEK